ncbi:hypothetical protein Tco_0732352 [Tanacetum coccineum]
MTTLELPMTLSHWKKVHSNDDYNVFVNEREHTKQPKSINDTYVVEKVDSNITPASSDMSNNEQEVDQRLKNLRMNVYGVVWNDQFAPIFGYGDLVQGNVTIKRVYCVEGLNHNLFSVGQFCDADLEVAFRKSTCWIRDL